MRDDWWLPGWKERAEAASKPAPPSIPRPPLSRTYLAGRVHFVQNADQAHEMIQAAYENPVSWIGIDIEYRFSHDQPVGLPNGDEWRDIHSIQPFCIAFAIVSEEQLLRFVVDLRVAGLLPVVQEVLDLPVAFASHNARSELFAFWSLGLREPRVLWDTMLAEKALMLGRSPWRRKSREALTDEEAASLKEAANAEQESSLSLCSVAARYNIAIPDVSAKAALQSSFLTKPMDEPLTNTEVEYCAVDAQRASLIRGPQRAACDRAGILETLDRVVMVWNVTVAEIQWHGVLYDRDKCRLLLDGSARVRERLGTEFTRLGIANPNSAEQLANLLQAAGLGQYFPKTETGRLSTRDNVLEGREHLHPAIPLVRRWRKVRQLASDPAVLGLVTGADGRIHAEFNALGADSGRTQARQPNLLGIGRIFHPLIQAPKDWGIGEADLSQIEVGVAAGLFRDAALVADFNAGDVYAAMAQRIFANQIPQQDTNLDWRVFKAKYAELRNRTKPLVLGIIYGKTVYGIALDLGISRRKAQELWDSFRLLYPTLCEGMERARTGSIRRGYAYISGLRRFRAGRAAATPHEERGLGNSYVQGTAALVFFDAGNRLRRLYRRHGARLIIPIHDAFVFEAPLDEISTVAELTRSILIQTVQEWFPDLHARAEINIKYPECWNHKGHRDSVERFIENPMLEL